MRPATTLTSYSIICQHNGIDEDNRQRGKAKNRKKDKKSKKNGSLDSIQLLRQPPTLPNIHVVPHRQPQPDRDSVLQPSFSLNTLPRLRAFWPFRLGRPALRHILSRRDGGPRPSSNAGAERRVSSVYLTQGNLLDVGLTLGMEEERKGIQRDQRFEAFEAVVSRLILHLTCKRILRTKVRRGPYE